jgi:RNA polymerase sigma-70 factor (ECF subfamily)
MQAELERVFREESGVVLAALIGQLGDFDLAEDAFQEAVRLALERWPGDGLPRNPAAWLTTTARRRALDRLRHRRMRADKRADLRLAELARREAARPDEPDVNTPVPDERLRLIFTCCHPALAQETQVALTLRTLGGLSTRDVADAFLVSEPSMAKRLVRAKKKIREARIPYRIPRAEALPERLAAVLAVVYLIFNRGWSESGARDGLSQEAIRLARVLYALLPDEPEVAGLLSLMLLHHARASARVVEGCWVPLDEQDRERWDWPRIREGQSLLRAALARARLGPYQLQASISLLHAEARDGEQVQWDRIAALYERLEELAPSPIVHLNRAVALGRAEGPEAGLALLAELASRSDARLESYRPWHAAWADLLERLGRDEEASQRLRRALELTASEPERRYMASRLARLGSH